jgi:hypothetical protein
MRLKIRCDCAKIFSSFWPSKQDLNEHRTFRTRLSWLCMIPKLCLCANPSILRAALLSPCAQKRGRRNLDWRIQRRRASNIPRLRCTKRPCFASPSVVCSKQLCYRGKRHSRMPVPAVDDSSLAVWGRLLSFWPPSFILRSYPALRPCVQSIFFLEF